MLSHSTEISEPNQTEETSYTLADIKQIVGLDVAPVDNNGTKEIAGSPKSTDSADDPTNAMVAPGDFPEASNERKLWQSGWVKLILVGGLLGIVALIAAIALNGVAGIRLTDDTETEEVIVEGVSNPDELAGRKQEEQIANLKTANALGNQASVLENQPQRATEIRPQPQTETTSTTPTAPEATPTEATRPGPSSQTVVARPAQIRPRRPVAVSRAPVIPQATTVAAAPLPSPARIDRNRSAIRPVDASRIEEVDPFELRNRLSGLGSYGQVQSSNTIASTETLQAALPGSVTTVSNQPVPVMVDYSNTASYTTEVKSNEKASRPLPTYMERSDSTPIVEDSRGESEETSVSATSLYDSQTEADELALETAVLDNTYESGADFIMRNSTLEADVPLVTEILPGISAKGSIVSPVAWAADIASTAGAIELTENLVSNGAVVMPRGTQLMVSLQEMSNSGMMTLEVTSIVLPASGYEHMQIPASAITIQGADGQLLVAKEVSGYEDDLNRLDLNQAFLGALGQIGGILNRPSSSSTAVGISGSASATQYGSPSIIGAILEGSANSLINQRTERNRDRRDAIEGRPSIWMLENGSNVEIFINQAVVL